MSNPAGLTGPAPEEAALSGFAPEYAAALAGPDWLRSERRSAAEGFHSAEMPTDALEEWRYSRIGDLDIDRFEPAALPGSAGPGVSAIADQLLAVLGDSVSVVRTMDGFVAGVERLGAGLEIEDLAHPPQGDPAGDAATDPDPYVTLNRAFAPARLRVRSARGSGPATVVVVHQVSGGGVAAFPRLSVEAAEQSELSVVEVLTGAGGSLVVPVTELEAAAASHLSYVQVQLLDDGAWQIGFQRSRVGRDATLVSAAVAIGGEYARLRSDSSLVAQGASGKLLAVYFGEGTQMHDFRTVQHHSAPKTQSELIYKGAVANTSRSVYSGLIRVEKGARGTNAMQTNRNLVLHDGAHADSVPNLEIEDNDVRCNHASAVGPIAEDQRFYLESRGVPPEVADRLIAVGFLDEVLEQLPVPGLAVPLRGVLAAKLATAELNEAKRRQPALSASGSGER